MAPDSFISEDPDKTVARYTKDHLSEHLEVRSISPNAGESASKAPKDHDDAPSRRLRLVRPLRHENSNSNFNPNKTEVDALAISPDASVALSASGGSIECWNLRSNSSFYKVSGSYAIFSPFGQTIATVRDWCDTSRDGNDLHDTSYIKIRNWAKKKLVVRPESATSLPLAFSPDGKLLAAGKFKNRLAILNAEDGKEICVVMSHIDQITHAAFTPDGKHVATLSRDSTLRVSDVMTGRTQRKLELETSRNPRALGISPDGKFIISIWSGSVHIWSPADGTLSSYNLNHVRQTEGWPLRISPDCRFLACRTEDGVDVSDIFTGKVLGAIEHIESPATVAAFSFDSGILAIGMYSGLVELWEVLEESQT